MSFSGLPSEALAERARLEVRHDKIGPCALQEPIFALPCVW